MPRLNGPDLGSDSVNFKQKKNSDHEQTWPNLKPDQMDLIEQVGSALTIYRNVLFESSYSKKILLSTLIAFP